MNKEEIKKAWRRLKKNQKKLPKIIKRRMKDVIKKSKQK